MPKLNKATERIRAEKLTKAYVRNGFSQVKLAREQGVTRQTINKKLHRKPTIDKLQEFLDSKTLDKDLIRVAKDGLQAKWGKVKDHNIRYRFWNGLMVSKGKIKQNGRDDKHGDINLIRVEVTNVQDIQSDPQREGSSGDNITRQARKMFRE